MATALLIGAFKLVTFGVGTYVTAKGAQTICQDIQTADLEHVRNQAIIEEYKHLGQAELTDAQLAHYEAEFLVVGGG